MKTTLISIFLILILLSACHSSRPSRAHLYSQVAPESLKGKTWVLETITSRQDSTQHHLSKKPCPVTLQFDDHGAVWIRFSDFTKRGAYKADNNQFQYLYLLHEKIVYTPDDPACISVATTVGIFMRGAFTFQVENQSLVLLNANYRITLHELLPQKP